MADRAKIDTAWRILIRTRRELPRIVKRRPGPRLTLGGGNPTGNRDRSQQRMLTGGSLAGAVNRLVDEGWSEAEAREVLRTVVLERFRKFAAGWSGYCNGDGWLRQLLLVDEGLRNEIAARHGIGDLVETALDLRDGAGLPDIMKLVSFGQSQSRLTRELRGKAEHPAVDLMVRVHGLPPDLARAVALYSETVPWWVYLLINVLLVIAGWIFWLAVTDPTNEVFTNDSVGGVGPGHYFVLPLMIIGMVAAQVWLVKDTPRREQAWREWFDRYKQDTPGDGSGDRTGG